MFAMDYPVMVNVLMALLLETFIDDSKIIQKTQDEKIV